MTTPRETLESLIDRNLKKQYKQEGAHDGFVEVVAQEAYALGRQEALEEIREDVKAIEYARISGYSMVNRDQVISSIDKASSLQSPNPSKKE